MISAQANASSRLTLARFPRSLRRRFCKPAAFTTSVLCVCLFVAGPGGVPVSFAAASDEKPHTPAPTDEGFTRESMAELGHAEAAPAPAGPIVSPRVVHSEVDSKDFVPHHRQHVQHARHIRRAPEQTRVAAVHARPSQRNPVVSFVYWWNGLVIRKFHTKFGTVLLGTVGAKT